MAMVALAAPAALNPARAAPMLARAKDKDKVNAVAAMEAVVQAIVSSSHRQVTRTKVAPPARAAVASPIRCAPASI